MAIAVQDLLPGRKMFLHCLLLTLTTATCRAAYNEQHCSNTRCARLTFRGINDFNQITSEISTQNLSVLHQLIIRSSPGLALRRADFDYPSLHGLQWLDLDKNSITSLDPKLFGVLDDQLDTDVDSDDVTLLIADTFAGLQNTTGLPTTENNIESTSVTGETVVPTTETTIIAAETVVPATETTIIAAETVVPATETTIIAAETVVTTTEFTIIAAETVVPTTETIIIAAETVVPATETTIIAAETVVPTTETTIIAAEKVVPTTETIIIAAETVVPATEFTIIAAETVVPTTASASSVPSSEATSVVTEIVPPTSTEVPTRTERVTEHATEPTSVPPETVTSTEATSIVNEHKTAKDEVAIIPAGRSLPNDPNEPHSAGGVFNNLMSLYLRHNQLESIQPNSFQGLPQLRTLLLSDNRISLIDENAFRGLEILFLNLDLGNNMISTLYPKSFLTNVNLESLSLYGNRLEGLDSSLFEKNTKLQLLDLSFNTIDDLSNFPLHVKSLQTLLIKHCEIKTIPVDYFSNLPNLKFLNLNGNNLEKITTGVFTSSPNLMRIQLEDNKLKSLSVDKFQEFYPILKEALTDGDYGVFMYEGNPWDCATRDMIALRLWFRNKQIPSYDKTFKCSVTNTVVNKVTNVVRPITNILGIGK